MLIRQRAVQINRYQTERKRVHLTDTKDTLFEGRCQESAGVSDKSFRRLLKGMGWLPVVRVEAGLYQGVRAPSRLRLLSD